MRATLGFFAPLLALAAALTLAITMYGNRDRYDGRDFSRYYERALALRTGGNPWRARPRAHAGARAGREFVFAYPPAFFLLMSPLTRLPQKAAYWTWQTVQIVSLAAALWLALSELGPVPDRRFALSMLALAFLFPPVYTSLHWGQPTCLLLLLLIGSWRFSRRGHESWAGLLLAAAALLKMYPAVVGGYFLFRRRWKVVAYGALWGLGGAFLLVALYGVSANLDFFSGTRASVEWLGRRRNLSILGNVRALMMRLYGGELTPAGWALEFGLTGLADLATVAAAGMLTLGARTDRAEADGLCWSLWVMAAILLSPIAWSHYLPLLLPMYLFIIFGVLRERPGADNEAARARVAAGLWLVALAAVGFIVPHYWHPARGMRGYLPALVASFIGAALVLDGWNKESTPASGLSLRERRLSPC